MIQFIKFGIVGVSNTLINLGVYYFCIYVLGLHYQLANLIGFFVSVTNAYYWNSKYVFKGDGKRSWSEHIKQYGKTVTAYGGTYLLGVALLWLWVEKLHIPEGIAPLINLIITIPLNFVINKFWTFRKGRPTTSDSASESDRIMQKQQ